jgi:ribosomal protein S18 acetylase RimI-like enzyme
MMRMDDGKDRVWESLKGADIRPVSNAKKLDEWIAVSEEAFGKKRSKELYGILLKEKDITLYGCHHGGKIVTTLMLYRKGKTAGIHVVGTKKAFRGRGFGTRLTKFALRAARERGCDVCVLQASDMGRRIYRDIGFREYGAIRHREYPAR